MWLVTVELRVLAEEVDDAEEIANQAISYTEGLEYAAVTEVEELDE